jgi:hypothetical protein
MTVVLFTTALFLSGYAIQQRTLRDLREAIKPRPKPSPLIFLPDRFHTSTTELEDGTVVEISGSSSLDREKEVIQVRPSVSEDQAVLIDNEKQSAKDRDNTRELKSRDGKGKQLQQVGGDGKKEKPISRAERRRRIKEEIRQLSEAKKPMYYQRRLW